MVVSSKQVFFQEKMAILLSVDYVDMDCPTTPPLQGPQEKGVVVGCKASESNLGSLFLLLIPKTLVDQV